MDTGLDAKPLKRTGHTYAARAMRDRSGPRETRRSAQATGGADSLVCVCSREPMVRIERACLFILSHIREDKVPPIICALSFVLQETREELTYERPAPASAIPPCRAGFSPSTIIPVGRRPFWIPGLRPGQLEIQGSPLPTAFPERARASGTP